MRLGYIDESGERQLFDVALNETHSVVDLAAALSGLPRDTPGLTLRVYPLSRVHGAVHVLEPLAQAAEWIRAGDDVCLAKVDHVTGSAPRVVLREAGDRGSGAGSGRSIGLGDGVHEIGNDPRCAVYLDDPLISAVHAKLLVGSVVEILDAGSPAGVLVQSEFVARAQLCDGDEIRVGNTDLEVSIRDVDSEPLRPDAPAQDSSTVVVQAIPFGRWEGSEVSLPAIPVLPEPRSLPRLAMVAPAVLGLGLFMVTHSPLSLLMVALSPLLLLGSHFDSRRQRAVQESKARAAFDAACEQAAASIVAAHQTERTVRAQRWPEPRELRELVELRDARLWSTTAEHPEFLTARIGRGNVATLSAVSVPAADHEGLMDLVARREQLASVAGTVAGAACFVDLASSGGVAACGPQARDVVSAMIAALVTTHSPQLVQLVAVLGPDSSTHFEWLAWLPHACQDSRIVHDSVTAQPQAIEAALAALESLIAARSGSDYALVEPSLRGPQREPWDGSQAQERCAALPAVVVVIDADAPCDLGRMVRLAQRGPDFGVHVLWLSQDRARVPSACRTVVNSDGRVEDVRRGEVAAAVEVDLLEPNAAQGLARLLAPLVDAAHDSRAAGRIPARLGLVELLGSSNVTAVSLANRWQASRSLGVPLRLRCAIGVDAMGPVHLDLSSHGPHALVAGTTGSGKSELLQAWVLSLAAQFGPHAVQFLFVDYKGGAAFAQCAALPHAAGIITDLNPRLAARALTSLRAELRRRERNLADANAKDLDELESRRDPHAPARLVIVVDEFAALIREVPGFVEGMIDIAQRGRSLGLNLILATQRPAGVVSDAMKANLALRIALRLPDDSDSLDVLGARAASRIDPQLPGRALVARGGGKAEAFQVAHPGARTSDQDSRTVPHCVRVDITGAVSDPSRGQGSHSAGLEPAPDATQGLSDAKVMIDAMREAAQLLELAPARRAWRDPLPTELDPLELTARASGAAGAGDGCAVRGIVWGLIDDPAQQDQPYLELVPGSDGPVLVVGCVGSGVHEALQAAVVAALTRPTPVDVYVVQSSARFEASAQCVGVGGVVQVSDSEGVDALLSALASRSSSSPHEALLVVESLEDLLAACAEPGRLGTLQRLTEVLRHAIQGRVAVVLGGERLGGVPSTLQALISSTVVLRMHDEQQYAIAGVRRGAIDADAPPGAGVHAATGRQVQCAVVSDSGAWHAVTQELCPGGARVIPGRAAAPPVRRAPSVVLPRDVPPELDGKAVIGVDVASLEPYLLEFGTGLLIAGEARSGKSATLYGLARAVRLAYPQRPTVHMTMRRSRPVAEGQVRAGQVEREFASLCTLSFEGARAVTAGLEEWSALLAEEAPAAVVFVEHVGDFAEHPQLSMVLRNAMRAGHTVIAEDHPGACMAGLLCAELRATKRGILLGSSTQDAQMLWSVPVARQAKHVQGRAVVIDGATVSHVQLTHWDAAAQVGQEFSTDLAIDVPGLGAASYGETVLARCSAGGD